MACRLREEAAATGDTSWNLPKPEKLPLNALDAGSIRQSNRPGRERTSAADLPASDHGVVAGRDDGALDRAAQFFRHLHATFRRIEGARRYFDQLWKKRPASMNDLLAQAFHDAVRERRA